MPNAMSCATNSAIWRLHRAVRGCATAPRRRDSFIKHKKMRQLLCGQARPPGAVCKCCFQALPSGTASRRCPQGLPFEGAGATGSIEREAARQLTGGATAPRRKKMCAFLCCLALLPSAAFRCCLQALPRNSKPELRRMQTWSLSLAGIPGPCVHKS